jgi:alanyl-tRNA synthetase
MISQEIRRRFIQYFKEQGHVHVASSPVVPHDDPSLLFNNAGMNQFKDVFLGKSKRDYKRAVTSQKCIRAGGKHNDLDNVGHTTRHLTLFEMLGNFSFGDYFKEAAIEFAWDVTTKVFEFPVDKLWITVYEEDDEAFELWKKWMPENRIVRMGAADNFWAMGETGPCGPCSELYLDRGAQFGNGTSPKNDPSGERFLEFWNLVFMQYNRSKEGKLEQLPNQSIDTGAGLERVVSLKMGVDSLYGTDILRSLIAQVETLSGKKYDKDNKAMAPAFQVIADHIRSLSFAIADGAQPSNVERGYVLRKILRRAVRYGRLLGFQEPFLAGVLPSLVEMMGPDYPELVTAQNRIAEVLTVEEEAFFRTLKKGGNILTTVLEKTMKSPLKEITGEDAFKLKDTYGFPIEEIVLIAKDAGAKVNLDAFQLLEEQARELSRGAKQATAEQVEENLFKNYIEKHGSSSFVGYVDTKSEGTIMALVANGKFVDTLKEGEEGMVVLNQTPFYAEMGGQMGDVGTLSHHKAHFSVTDCHAPYPGVTVHVGKLEKGILLTGEPVQAEVDSARRAQIANHHTATHLLHWALEKVLGGHIRQAGSLVGPDRLRFDFSHHKPLSADELFAIEDLVNQKIREDREVAAYELPYEEAHKRSDIKQFFGEKYGSQVRVIDIDFSKELCGGTHTARLGTIGLFRIVKESSIAAGVRRIEAATGGAAERFARGQEMLAHQAAGLLKTTPVQLGEKVSALLEQMKGLETELKTFKREQTKGLAEKFSKEVIHVGKAPLIAAEVEIGLDELPLLAELIAAKHPSLVLLLAAKGEGKVQLLLRVSPDLVKQGIKAGDLIKEIAPCIEGSGGGRPDVAQAGGKNLAGIGEAFKKLHTLLKTL